MNQFSYLSEKIKSKAFSTVPFQHIIINDFFTEEHFNLIINSPQIKTKEYKSNLEVVQGLKELGYKSEPFPGCITDEKEYINFANNQDKFNKNLIKGYGKEVIEGYGLTMRLYDIRDQFLKDLMDYLKGDEFQNTLRDKFGITEHVDIETAYQKNLQHYEISPHCDTSRKALTYMINIYTNNHCTDLEMHTHLLKFKPEYEYLYSLWKHSNYDLVWTPWKWCETVKKTNTNNSISIFKPSFDTLHAVKIDEPHFKHQRNQIYGNLWFEKAKKTGSKSWQELDLISDSIKSVSKSTKIKKHLKEALKAAIYG